jgi:hypothetical protein
VEIVPFFCLDKQSDQLKSVFRPTSGTRTVAVLRVSYDQFRTTEQIAAVVLE